MDVEADLAEIRQPFIPTPITPEQIEQLFTSSKILSDKNIVFESMGDSAGICEADHVWRLILPRKIYCVTFYPEVCDRMPFLRLMSYGEPLFKEIFESIN
jgi:hypothetical protein